MFLKRYLLGSSKRSVVRTLSIISILGIGLGMIAMVVILSVMAGFDEAIQSRLFGVEPHVEVLDDRPELKKELEALAGPGGVVQSYARQDVLIRTMDGLYSGAVASGLTSESLARVSQRVRNRVEVIETPTGTRSVSNNTIETTPIELLPKEIAVGVDLARSLGILEGDTVTLIAPESLLLPPDEIPIYEKVRVKALLKTAVQELDRNGIFYDYVSGLKKLQESASLVKGYEIRLANPQKSEKLLPQITALTDKPVHTWQSQNSALFYSLKMEKMLMGIFLGLTVFVSSFSVIAVLVLLVTEKQHDIGILRAIGASPAKVRSIFLRLGIVLGSLGIFGGTAIGLFLCWLIDKYPIFKLPDIYQDTTIPVKVELVVIGSIVALGALLVFFGSWLPVGRVVRLKPIDALRHGGN